VDFRQNRRIVAHLCCQDLKRLKRVKGL
jgi:hypothetical protein